MANPLLAEFSPAPDPVPDRLEQAKIPALRLTARGGTKSDWNSASSFSACSASQTEIISN
jgi:hypothetical protein